MRKDTYYHEGDLDILEDSSIKIAIVGSRSILPYTISILENLFDELENFDICIVSGGMYGVDIYSHNLALSRNLKTIFVLPQGIENYKNSSLYNQIKIKENSKFLFISKYPKLASPKKHTYIERNKIIVDLSKLVFVAQASYNSGSLSTGNFSLRKGKPTVSLPFSLENNQFQGTNFLIEKGSKIYLSPESILKILGFYVDNIDLKIKELINFTPIGLQDLSKKLESDSRYLEKRLLKMILDGEIFFDGEKYYL